ncbi:outer membrane protein assembly factor BamB family protein [Streptomyces halstedii]|uniref:outer membrane protein assembly factor BamB family protein n=2 Tax=Streptomyces TaxID=1883 RepID=UPI00365A3217
MTQPNDESPQGGFGAPQDPPPGGFGAPSTPPPPPADPLGKQPPAQPPAAPAGPPTPPAGGFGAPQDPPPGGYGTPPPPGQTPPPPPAGYGYPQAPPPGQPGYGYPQQPPPGQPGYGYPQQPGQPGAYPPQAHGYPTAPTQPQYAAPQPGGGKKIGTQTKIIIAAVVAVALIVGGGVIYAAGGDDGGSKKNEASSAGTTGGEGKDGKGDGLAGGNEKAPANTASKVGFQLEQPKVDDRMTVVGSWITDKAYVKPGVYEITGFDIDKGTKLWSVPLKGQICAASRHMSEDYKTAVVFEEAKPTKEAKYPSCNQVGALDMNTGKLLWSKSVTSSSSGDKPVRFDEVTLSGTTVAAGGTGGGAAFDLDTGAELWKPKTDAQGCYDRGYGGGEALVAVRACGSYDDPQVTIQPLDATTGAPVSSYTMPAGVDYAHIVSTKPLVVAADVGDTAGDGSSISDFFSIDAETGKLIVRISADADKYAGDCGSTEVEKCTALAVGNNRIYVPTEEHEGGGEYGRTNEIVAFDLTTGKLVGGKADAGDRHHLVPLRMDGTNVIAYKAPPYDEGGQIVSVDGSTFKETVLMKNPGDETVRKTESSFSAYFEDILYGEGRMFLSPRSLSKPSTAFPDEKQYLAVSFTTR